MKNKKIFGNAYFLKPFNIEDISENYITWLNDDRVTNFLEIRHNKQTYKIAKSYIDSFYNEDNKYLWGIYTKSNKHIGTINISVKGVSSSEIGLMIGDKDFWGKGASDEAISLVLDFAFNTLNVRKISGGCYAENIGMVFTFKKLGFIRDEIITHRKGLMDKCASKVYRWSILSSDWNR
jgi:RimJ/RimL family protein N-acetyltransferase